MSTLTESLLHTRNRRPPTVEERYSFFYAEKLDEIRGENAYKRAEGLLKDAKEQVTKYVKKPSVKVALGPVSETKVSVSEKWGIDLMLLGSRELSGFKRLLMGQVASGVSEKASCHVLIIRCSLLYFFITDFLYFDMHLVVCEMDWCWPCSPQAVFGALRPSSGD